MQRGRHGTRALAAVLGLALARHATAAAFVKWSSFKPQIVREPCADAANAARVPSGLWGCTGELWTPGGPLSDWSFAGYAAGEAAIPDAPVAIDVKRDHGATGDGKHDDTSAVLAALRAAAVRGGGVVYFPTGRYLLTKQLNLTSGVVLRGAGRDATVLFFNTSLAGLYGWGSKYTPGKETSPYTWSGGLISSQRDSRLFKPETLYLGLVTGNATRGSRRLTLKTLRAGATDARKLIAPGQWVALGMFETPQADLARALCNNRSAVGLRLGPDFGNKQMLTHMSRVEAVGTDWVQLERPLHTDVSPAFKPTLYRSFNFKVSGVGVEDLAIDFPWTPYLGHHEEPGYNAIEFEAAVNSWVRRVRITNADAGIKLYASSFNTISDVEVGLQSRPRRGGRWKGRTTVVQETDKDGHLGIALHWASFDNLVERFNFTGLYFHELLVAGYSAHNVFSNGTGVDVCLDHHGGAPHNNLWTDIDLGSGLAAMRWSGAPEHFPFAGASNVFWNVRASKLPVRFNYVNSLAAEAGLAPLASLSTNSSAKTADGANSAVPAPPPATKEAARNAATAAMFESSRRSAKLPVMDRPAWIQGYGQVAVDMPLDGNNPTLKEAGDWFIDYDPARRVWPSNLLVAMKSSQSDRLELAPQRQSLLDAMAGKPWPPPLTTGNASTSAGTAAAVTVAGLAAKAALFPPAASPGVTSAAPSVLAAGAGVLVVVVATVAAARRRGCYRRRSSSGGRTAIPR